ncbi:MAG: DNA-binding protein [Sphingobium sp.]
MIFTGPQARAARALVQWPRDHVARLADVAEETLRAFEAGLADLDEDARRRLCLTLESGGAVFLPEDESGGVGVRLKFTAKDARAVNRMENEGGPVGSDDV